MTMQQDPFPIPPCFTASSSTDGDPAPAVGFASVKKPGQRVVSSVHRTKMAGHSRLITVTWCRDLFLHGLCVSVGQPDGSSAVASKVELKPWCFWRKQGSKRIDVDGNKAHAVHVFWDLRRAKFCGEPEPRSDYYVALVCDGEAALLLGDMKEEACRRTACRPSAIDAVMVSRKEHVFGKKRFSTRARFSEKGRLHEILIECGSGGSSEQPQMVVRIDGHAAIHVKHLQWKFRGNGVVALGKERVEVYWDVHDWLFSPAAGGLSHGLFIFKPLPAVHSSLMAPGSNEPPPSSSSSSATSSFCLFLYAWKIE